MKETVFTNFQMRLFIQAGQGLEEILASSRARLILLTAHHALEIKLSPGLPPVNYDKMRIAQVITYLVENATKFSPAGSPITIEAEAKENKLFIKVIDKGIGMNTETIQKLFNRFYQAEQVVSGKVRGSGLGLSICRGIVEARRNSSHERTWQGLYIHFQPANIRNGRYAKRALKKKNKSRTRIRESYSGQYLHIKSGLNFSFYNLVG
jgi:K+-sensing histidine kinase KdpD